MVAVINPIFSMFTEEVYLVERWQIVEIVATEELLDVHRDKPEARLGQVCQVPKIFAEVN